jgi:hypothetical protein
MMALLALACVSSAGGMAASVTAWDDGLPKQGQWRHGFAVADVNGDGFPDIVHGPPRKGAAHPVIFLGSAAGKWTVWNEAVFPDVPYDYGDAAVADFDGDGHLDLAFAMHLKGFVVMTNGGNGQFERLDTGMPYADAGTLPAFSSRAIAVVDWNGDGRPDILANGEGPLIARRGQPATGSTGLRLFLNGEDSWKVIGDEDDVTFGDAIAIGDFNGDSRPDAVTASQSMGVRAVAAMNDKGQGWIREELPGLPEHVLVWAVATGDFDNDGRDDAILGMTGWDSGGNKKHSIARYTFENDAWIRHAIIEDAHSPVTALAVGDFDGNGAMDLAAGHEDGRIALWYGDGQGGLAAIALDEAIVGEGRCYHLTFADCDRDGRDELVAAFAREIDGGFGGRAAQSTSQSEGALRVWKIQLRPNPAGDENG